MNILLFTTDFPQPSDWTRAPFNLQLSLALAASHRVAVVVPCAWHERIRSRPSGRPLSRRSQNMQVQYPTFFYPPRVCRWSHEGLMAMSTRSAVRGAVAFARPDVVIGYWAFPDGAVASRIARALDVPFVQMVGGSDVLTCKEGAERTRVSGVLRSADGVVAVGDHLRDHIVKLGVHPSKVSVVPRGVDTQLFSRGSKEEARRRLGIADGSTMLLWVGRMVPVKGLEVLLDAAGRLKQSGRAHRLWLVGDGPLGAELRHRSKALGLDVEFRSIVQHAELPDYYRAADVTVLSSHSEGIPNVLRESIACGTPFVATRVGGVPEIARGGVDELVAPRDGEALARAIDRVLRRGALGLASRSTSVSWAESAQMLVDVVKGLDKEARSA